jgi:hypothetical protein
MIVSYDLDGVLAKIPKVDHKKYRFMNGKERKEYKQKLLKGYLIASKLYEPKEDNFYVISARKMEQVIYFISKDWLSRNFGERVLALHLLDKSRTYENVIRFKAETIKKLGIERHYEDDEKVLKGIRKCLPEVELFLIKENMSQPIKFEK